MKLHGIRYSLKKKVSYENKKKSSIKSIFNLKLIHKIFDTINISFLIFIFIFSFLSFNSQKEWTKTYKLLSKIKANNNNLIDYISKTEEFYISELESLKTLKETKPGDLIYLERYIEEKENSFKEKIKNLFYGLKDSTYQLGY